MLKCFNHCGHKCRMTCTSKHDWTGGSRWAPLTRPPVPTPPAPLQPARDCSFHSSLYSSKHPGCLCGPWSSCCALAWQGKRPGVCCGHQNKRTGLVQVSNTSTSVCGCPCRQPCMQDCCCLSARTCNPSTLAQRLLGQMPPGPFSHALSIASTCKPSGRITLHQLEVVITCLCVPDGCEPTPGQRQHHTHTPGRGRDNNKPTVHPDDCHKQIRLAEDGCGTIVGPSISPSTLLLPGPARITPQRLCPGRMCPGRRA